MKKKNMYLYICICILVIFTIGYFIVVNKVSYAFEYDEKAINYDNKIVLIKKASEVYAQKNDKLFEGKDSVYITVNDLIKSDLLIADYEDKIIDPTSSGKKYLNDLKIRLTKKDNKIEVKIVNG